MTTGMDVQEPLLLFLSGRGTDHRGRRHRDILSLSNTDLEREHDYIQWLFPLFTASAFNARAPVLTGQAVGVARGSATIREATLQSLHRMLAFYGFELDASPSGGACEVESGPASNFDERARVWLTPGNHNYRRLTRILVSLRLLGLSAYAEALYRALRDLQVGYGPRIDAEVWRHWADAVETVRQGASLPGGR